MKAWRCAHRDYVRYHDTTAYLIHIAKFPRLLAVMTLTHSPSTLTSGPRRLAKSALFSARGPSKP